VTTLPSLDQQAFDELYESVCEKPDTVASLYDTFLSNAVRLIESLHTADSRSIREKTLHALKGSAAMMGAARVARLAADLQETSATMQDETLQNWIEQIAIELDQTRRAVDARLASLGTARRGD
jgi:HPt (histidine-containing phosphotransfer) domain-containing protein